MRVRNHQPGRDCVPRTGREVSGWSEVQRYVQTGMYTWGSGWYWAMYSVVYVQQGRASSGVNTARRGQGRPREWQGMERSPARVGQIQILLAPS